jgi:hypothetical protein
MRKVFWTIIGFAMAVALVDIAVSAYRYCQAEGQYRQAEVTMQQLRDRK